MKTYKMKINGHDYEVAIKEMNGTNVTVEVNGKAYDVELPEEPKTTVISPRPNVATNQSTPKTRIIPKSQTPQATPAAAGGNAGAVRSPLPGVVLSINTQQGATVKRGDVLLVLEAMKMENNIMADRDGTVTSILVSKGDSVLEGADLVVIG